MTPAELDALLARLHARDYVAGSRAISARDPLVDEAAAAIAELRAEVANTQAFADIELQTCKELRARAERAEAEVAQMQSRQRWRDEAQITHYEGCWRDHYGCAMERIKALEGERDALKRIKCFNCGMLPQIDAVKGKP